METLESQTIDTGSTLKESATNLDPESFALTIAQVLNEDILPLILRDLKDTLHFQDDSDGSGWKANFASLILVNRTFFHVAVGLLWNTMENITPALKLLPWVESEYKGLGMFKYTGSSDWKRFNLYTRHIQHLALQTPPDTKISPPWLLELVTLHGKPDPMFSALRSITISPEAYPDAMPLLFILAGPRLEILKVATCSELDVSGEQLPPDWVHHRDASIEEEAQENILAILPRLSVSCPMLRSFHYRGFGSPKLFHRISTLNHITTLDLTISNIMAMETLRDILHMGSLANLTLVAPLLHGAPNLRAVKEMTKKTRGKPKNRRIEGTILHFTTLRLVVPEYLPYYMWTWFRMTAKHLSLEFIKNSEILPIHLSLYYCLSTETEELTLKFVMSNLQTHDQNTATPSSEVPSNTDLRALVNLKRCIHLQRVAILNVPTRLWTSISSMLQGSMAGWKRLISLIFRVADTDPPGNNWRTRMAHPGLSFLRAIVLEECPSLETLEFPFDNGKIVQEDLSPFLQFDISRSREPSPNVLLDSHPLRDLTIYTVSENDQSLDLDLKRKIRIAVFLDRIFPRLSSVEGSASVTWSEINDLVKSYQEVKNHLYSQIEAM